MTTIPTRFATNTNYSTGPDTGTPTKVDPASAANGFVRGVIAAPQHVNFKLSEIIEYLRDRALRPELIAEVKDDFMPGAYDSANGLLHTDHTWQVSEGQAYAQEPICSDGSGRNPGVHAVTIPAGASYEIHLGAELTTPLLPWGDLESATIVLSLFSSNFTGAEMFCGLAKSLSDGGLGTDAVGLWFDKATSDNWLIRHMVGGADDATNSLVALVASDFVVVNFERISSTFVEVRLNGTLVATLTDASTAPSDNEYLNLGLVATAGSANLIVHWDYIHVRWSTPNRAS